MLFVAVAGATAAAATHVAALTSCRRTFWNENCESLAHLEVLLHVLLQVLLAAAGAGAGAATATAVVLQLSIASSCNRWDRRR